MEGVDTVVEEGQRFLDRHPDLPPQAQTLGGLTWGLMRALAECPNCPGVIRNPIGPTEDPWLRLACPKCGWTWYWSKPSDQAEAPKRKRSRIDRTPPA